MTVEQFTEWLMQKLNKEAHSVDSPVYNVERIEPYLLGVELDTGETLVVMVELP
jgi:hypothetical protein